MLLFHPLVTPALSPWPQGGWTPWAPARLAMELPRYSPIDYVDKLKTPTLFVSALEVCDDVQLKQQAMLSTPLCPHLSVRTIFQSFLCTSYCPPVHAHMVLPRLCAPLPSLFQLGLLGSFGPWSGMLL